MTEFILLPALWLAASANTPPAAQETPGAAALRGEVVSKDSGEGLTPVVVRIHGTHPHRERTTRESTITDAAGRFEFSGLEPGDYIVTFQSKALFDAGGRLENHFLQKVFEDVKLESGQTYHMHVEAKPGAKIIGRVLNAKGEPAARVMVMTASANPEHVTTATDENGQFVIRGVKPDEDAVVAVLQHGLHYTVQETVAAAQLDVGQTHAMEISIPQPPEIVNLKGAVAGPDGEPIQHICHFFLCNGDNTITGHVIARDGVFEGQFPAGRYTLSKYREGSGWKFQRYANLQMQVELSAERVRLLELRLLPKDPSQD